MPACGYALCELVCVLCVLHVCALRMCVTCVCLCVCVCVCVDLYVYYMCALMRVHLYVCV
jgi:hypothetical protein